ncbi:hypothetical protein SprV_0602230900 [Sparganum proliferum]
MASNFRGMGCYLRLWIQPSHSQLIHVHSRLQPSAGFSELEMSAVGHRFDAVAGSADTGEGWVQLMDVSRSLHLKAGLTPRDLTATALNSSAIRVTWKEPSRSGELSGKYNLIIYSDVREKGFTLHATEDIITDLEPSTTYELKVCAFWENGRPVNEYASTSVTTLPLGLTPRDLTATALNSSAIRVTWKEPSRSGELSGKYNLIIYSDVHEKGFTLHATEDIIMDLEPSTTYELKVCAFWENGRPVNEYASTSVTTLPLGLTPRDLTATALNSSAIRVTWKEPSRSGELSGKYNLIIYSDVHEKGFTLHATEDIIMDLEPSTTYELKVCAFWENGRPVNEYASTSVTTLPLDVSTSSASEFPRELGSVEELASTEDSQVVLVDLDKDLEPSDGIVPTLVELSEIDEIRNMSDETFSPESPDQPNSSEVIKGSFISLAGFSLLWLSLVVAL